MCTRNRAEQLRRVLQTAAAMDRPDGLVWEFLLVDNGSTDLTRQVVAEFAEVMPIRHIFEPAAGLSNARNRGVDEARGDYICWTDDDVLIDRGWLAGYAAAFVRHPDDAYFGGPIELRLEGEKRPDWFEENREALGTLLAERELGDEEVALDPAQGLMPYGANYAVRTREQRAYRYDPLLGVSPAQRRLGEESAVLHAIAAAGGGGLWVPQARVTHIIPAHRQTLAYVVDYQKSAGETAAYIGHHATLNFMGPPVPPSRRHVRGAPAYLWRLMAGRWLAYRWARVGGTSAQWLDHLRWYGFYRGAISYWQKTGARGGKR